MKTLEKLILCCIWICIAIVLVLIKDQTDLNRKIIENQNSEIEEQEKKENYVLMGKTEVLKFIAENLPVMKQAEIQFQSDGLIELSVEVNDEILEEVSLMVDHELVDVFLPMLKGTKVGCKAYLSKDAILMQECQAGVFSIPQSLLEIMSEKVNENLDMIPEILTDEKLEYIYIGLLLNNPKALSVYYA